MRARCARASSPPEECTRSAAEGALRDGSPSETQERIAVGAGNNEGALRACSPVEVRERIVVNPGMDSQ
eukprot:14927936-Alexandrium_andersonii.AAC.1